MSEQKEGIFVGLVTKQDVERAEEAIKASVNHTPLQYDRHLSEKYQCNVYLKREDLQKVRSFKLRGAYYAIHSLPREQVEKGVVCASAGNHAQGVAYTCHELKTPAVIFMPSTTPNQKISQVKFFGGEFVDVQLIGDTFDESAAAAKEFTKEHRLTFINPFNDEHIIAGQGTVALEIFEDAKDLEMTPDYIISAIGGGGLVSGVSTYTKAVSPQTKVIGSEPLGARSMELAFAKGHPEPLEQIEKFVDGAAVKEVGDKTYAHAKSYVDELISVDEGLVCSTILELYSKQAIVVEPAGAVSVASLEMLRDEIIGKNVVCIISGGNNDINRMAEIEERSLIYEGLKHYFLVHFPQRPGALREFVTDILGPNDDITRFEYTKKVNRGSGPVVLGVQLQEKAAYEPLIEKMKQFDPSFVNLKDDPTLYTLLV